MRPQEYQQLVQQNLPPRPVLKNTLWAFVVGGLICTVGQVILSLVPFFEPSKTGSAAITLAAMILIGSLLTGFGVYDELAEVGGAGAAIPITGFANTVTAAAMEYRREGYLQGMGAKMLIIASPVITYGILVSFIVALIKSLILGVL
ncbi:MAG: SpoVA/SpoVAEb family sporulation membrane protein [Firmicutes bacterium]|nr:SpoVA/SpoVAEb family sporulation membrane protein [Bacillota bacterium]